MSSAQARMDSLAIGRAFAGVYRGIVSLPEPLTTAQHPLAERFVFFESVPPRRPSETLADLLHAVWRVDTTQWVHDGLIYNVYSALELIRDRVEPDVPPAHFLFSTAFGSGEADPRMLAGVRYARADEVDLFVRPATHQALLRVMREIDLRYDAAAVARSASR